VHPQVLCVGDFAEANAARHASQSIVKIRDVLARSGGTFDTDLDTKARRIYAEQRAAVEAKMHVSINLRVDRALAMIETGALQPTRPDNTHSRRHRDNAEKAMRLTEDLTPPIYGALNIDSPVGGAPCFRSDFWLQLDNHRVRDRLTFTARDSYDVTKPWRADFEENLASRAFSHEVFTWNTVPDYFLNRFWGIQETLLPHYVEAQVWGGVLLEDVAHFHAHESVSQEFQVQLDELGDTARAQYVVDRIRLFTT